MWNSRGLFAFTFYVGAIVFAPTASRAACEKPYVFFDLGNTLVDTKTHDYNPMSLMPGAAAYVEKLLAAGYPLGLIVDVPEEWGRNYPPGEPVKDLKTAKWLRTLDFINGKVPEDKTSWEGKPFDANLFGEFKGEGRGRVFVGRVLQPMKDAQRKDGGSLVLFEEAKKIAEAAGCDALYISEAEDQLKWANAAGVPSYGVGHGLAGEVYLPEKKIAKYVADEKKRICGRTVNPTAAAQVFPMPDPNRRRPRGF
ncbi:MAG: hypothetical protein JST04_17905 [Bdellovibrionales bacterium]|nr:hypothetical protein [Bdellovibrionales bacterium]